MVVKHLFEGGLAFMSVIYALWIVVIFIVIKFLINYFSDKKDLQKLTKLNSVILFVGSFTFLIGLFGQMIGMYGALAVVSKVDNISPTLFAGGIGVSLICALYGFGLLLVSSIIWFIFRNLIQK
jgi:biopolymer transport protein ExbB/TolQ